MRKKKNRDLPIFDCGDIEDSIRERESCDDEEILIDLIYCVDEMNLRIDVDWVFISERRVRKICVRVKFMTLLFRGFYFWVFFGDVARGEER